MERRDALRLLALGGLGIACSSPSSEGVLAAATQNAQPTKAESTAKLATPEPTPAPNAIEQRVKNAVFSTWKGILSKTQDIDQTFDHRSLSMSIITPPDMVNDIQLQALNPNAKPTETPLLIRWIGIDYRYDLKWIGELKVKSLKVSAKGEAPKDAASIANKIEWAGIGNIDFVQNRKSILERASGSGDLRKRWLEDKNPREPLPEFHPQGWVNENWGILTTIIDGKIKYLSGPYASSGMFDRMLLPALSDSMRVCSPVYNCKEVRFELK